MGRPVASHYLSRSWGGPILGGAPRCSLYLFYQRLVDFQVGGLVVYLGHTSFLSHRAGLFRDFGALEPRGAQQGAPEGACLAGSSSPPAYNMGLGPGGSACGTADLLGQ